MLALDISVHDAEAAAVLPPHDRDAFDRMLVAQAQRHVLEIPTGNPGLSAYDVEIIDATA